MPVTVRSRFPQIAAELVPRVEAATRVGAELIEAEAKSRVPVNTGRLRDAIHVESEGFGDWKVVAGGGPAFYGHMVEFGTTNMPAHPFLIPAAEASRAAVVEAIRLALSRL